MKRGGSLFGAVHPKAGSLFHAVFHAIGIKLEQRGIKAKQAAHQQHPAIAVLDVCRMNDGLHQQALRIDQDMALLAFDFLAGIEARRVAAGPPFSALFTLWLSITPAVGLASRPACSRHCT